MCEAEKTVKIKSAIYPALGIVLGFTALFMGPGCSDTEADLSLQKNMAIAAARFEVHNQENVMRCFEA
jgi:hypothetical protein